MTKYEIMDIVDKYEFKINSNIGYVDDFILPMIRDDYSEMYEYKIFDEFFEPVIRGVYWEKLGPYVDEFIASFKNPDDMDYLDEMDEEEIYKKIIENDNDIPNCVYLAGDIYNSIRDEKDEEIKKFIKKLDEEKINE